MSAVAERGGVAKATIYNHFRRRSELLDGVLLDELTELGAVASAAGNDLEAQLAAVGRALNVNPVLDGLRRPNPMSCWLWLRRQLAQVVTRAQPRPVTRLLDPIRQLQLRANDLLMRCRRMTPTPTVHSAGQAARTTPARH